MVVVSRVVGIALLLTAAWFTPAYAQETRVEEGTRVESADEEADRAAIRGLFARADVQKAARIGGLDLGAAERRLDSVDGETLHRAATQARLIEERLGAQNEIRISAITLIIVLLLVVVIILLV